jgi:hypothetical protein
LAQSGHSAKLPTSASPLRPTKLFTHLQEYVVKRISPSQRFGPAKNISLFFFRPFAASLAESFFPFL